MIPAFPLPLALRRWFLRREIAALERPDGGNAAFHGLHTWPPAPGTLLLVLGMQQSGDLSEPILLLAVLLLLVGGYVGATFYLWGRETRAFLRRAGSVPWRAATDPIGQHALLHRRKVELSALTADAST